MGSYIALPDKRHTFDRDRPRTKLSHLIEDHANGPSASRELHFREWVTLVEPHFGTKYQSQEAIRARVRELMTQDYSIHFHTFIPEDMSALVSHCIEAEQMPLSVLFAGEFGEEMIFVLRNSGGQSAREPTGPRFSPPQSPRGINEIR